MYDYYQNSAGFCFVEQIKTRITGITGMAKFKYERQNEVNSRRSSKKTSSSKGPISHLSEAL